MFTVQHSHTASIHYTLFLILLGITVVMLFLAPPVGHDALHWSYRIGSFADNIKLFGIHAFPEGISVTSYNGYGYGAPLFYGNIGIIIPSILQALGLSVSFCYSFAFASLFLLRAGIAYYCGKDAVSVSCGILFAVLYSYSPYMLELIFVRSALGELCASCFLPLVFWAFYKILTHRGDSYTSGLQLAVGMWGIICSHVLSTILVVLFLLVWFISFLPRMHSKLSITKSLVVTAVGTFVLSAYWLLPFLEQYTSQPIQGGGTTLNDFISNRLSLLDWFVPYIAQYVLFMQRGNGNVSYYPSGIFYLILLVGMLIITLHHSGSKLPVIFFCLSACILLAVTCSPIVTGLGIALKSLQFPWRLLAYANLFCVVAIVFMLHRNRCSKVLTSAVVLCFLVLAVCSIGYQEKLWIGFSLSGENHIVYSVNNGDSIYLPAESPDDLYLSRGECVTCTSPDVDFEWQRNADFSITIRYSNLHSPASFELPLYYYKGYQNSSATLCSITKSQSGLVLVTPEQECGELTISYQRTTLQILSAILSCCAWIAMFTILKLKRSTKK